MNRSKVKSGLIHSIGYNFFKKHLDIEFHYDGVHRFYNVPFIKYLGLKYASSHGHFFLKNIKRKYKSEMTRI